MRINVPYHSHRYVCFGLISLCSFFPLSLSFEFSMRRTDSNSDLFSLFGLHSMLIWYLIRNSNYVKIQFRNNKTKTYLHFCDFADLRVARYHINVSNNKPIGRSVSFLRASCMVSNLYPSYGTVRYGKLSLQ